MGLHVGYIRVSSAGQNTDRQLDGMVLDRVFIDKISGAMRDRPELNACLAYVRSGDTLHIHSIDRLARSLRDLQEIVDSLIARGITIVFESERLTFTNEDNPVSTMMLQMLGMIAQFERTLTRKRQREGIEIAKAKGKPNGRPKLDYSLRPKAQELLLKGYNKAQISKQLGLSRPSIDKLLKDFTALVTY